MFSTQLGATSNEKKQYQSHATHSVKKKKKKASTGSVNSFQVKQGAEVNETLALAGHAVKGTPGGLSFKQEKSDMLTRELAAQSRAAADKTIASLFMELHSEIAQRVKAQGVRKTTLRIMMHLTKGSIDKVTISPASGGLQDSLSKLLIGRRILTPYTGMRLYELKVN
ncbi:hypothetical protein L4C31_01845 [Aliivibrio sifiae]